MDVKIDTKDKFSEITIKEEILTANMAVELSDLLISQLSREIPHIIVNAENIKELDEEAINALSASKERFLEANASMVICNLQPEVYKSLDELDLIDFFNVTPTLSEAWDILQMEEIERELLNDFDEDSE